MQKLLATIVLNAILFVSGSVGQATNAPDNSAANPTLPSSAPRINAAPGLTKLERKVLSWLTTAVFYQIYPQSFYDSNGDGIGDLPGIIAKLDYIKSLGVTAIWLNPIYDSPFGDAGYDVGDYRKVAPRYGTNEDAKRLFEEAHRRGIREVLDLVAGHTSVEHEWFKDSCAGPQAKYANWYIWSVNAENEKWVKSPGPRRGFYLATSSRSNPR